LSKRELARRAHTSPAAIVWYENGTRSPTWPTIERLALAAGSRAEVRLVAAHAPDRSEANARLVQVLDLAEHLPRRRARRFLEFPPLPR
jgi:transcriptional regulator with XRE-family HTH domain